MKTQLQNLLLEAVSKGELQGKLKINEPMSAYTTWRIGGPVECFYQPQSIDDLQQLLRLLPEETVITWIGLGSNVLIRDAGLDGVVICTNGVLNNFTIDCLEQESLNVEGISAEEQSAEDKSAEGQSTEGANENTTCTITAEVGLPCAIFSRKAANQGINGAEFLSGIPGTIGGALAMNAGAFGGETWRNVVSVKMINRHGDIATRYKQDFNVSYRHVELKEATDELWFVSAQFRYERDEQGLADSKKEIKRLLAKRAETQPTKQANAGSVFKNPENDYAARLIESCGLKGEIINGAQISPKHANFIINANNATASDVEALIEKAKKTIKQQYNVTLETEVRILGKKH